MLQSFLSLIEAFQPAKGPPPQTLWPFFKWSLSGSERAVALGVVSNAVLGFSELVAAAFTGWAIDKAIATGPGDPVALWPLFLIAFLFFMIILIIFSRGYDYSRG